MPEQINRDRRRFFGTAATALAAAQNGRGATLRRAYTSLGCATGRLPRSGFITFYCRARRFAAMYSSNASREYGFSASFRPASSAGSWSA